MKHKEKKKHLESKYFIKTASMSRGPCNAQQDMPQSFVEAPGCSQAAGENTSSSEYFTCVSSPYKLAHHEEDGFHQLQQNDSYLGALNMPVSQSGRKRKIMEGHIGGPGNIQGDVPQTQSFMEAPGYNQAAGENASSSEYFTCVSSPSKLPRLNEEGIKEKPVPKDLVETKSSSDYSYTYSSSPSASNKEPFMVSVHGTDLRVMKIYYMHVQMKRGVAVLCQTEEGWEPPSKKIKTEEMTYIEEVHKNVPLSHMPGKNLPIDPEPSVDSRAQEKREKADCPTKPPTQVVHRRVSLRKALESGFRCMACCHVFPTLELLQEHVENGVREGFSCHVFHRAMAHMKYKRLKRKNKKLMKAT
ncbi:protein FAM170A-like [Myotis daubentonii]|uniref:protein FAM170A-like n=1 Tax=Myotis daubentonii TaxID=98922 RepID=UPI0028737F7B|nr:protein FAM170A-like [Myotis daubentonii]